MKTEILNLFQKKIKIIFKDPEDIDENIEGFTGDSGYFIEFFLGDINGRYTFSVIDTIENKMDLSALLNAKLWHKEVPIFKEYIKLKTIFVKLYQGENIDQNKKSVAFNLLFNGIDRTLTDEEVMT